MISNIKKMNAPKIIISCDPKTTISFKPFAAIINVADSPCQTFRADVPSFWTPIQEVNQWGYSPFYMAAKVVDYFRESDKPVLISCHAGVNRSVSVAFAIMKSDGMTDEQIFATNGLHKEWLKEAYDRNINLGYVFPDTIAMLKARHLYPDFSICGLLSKIGSPNQIYKKRAA